MKTVSVDPERMSVCRELLAALRDRQSVQQQVVVRPMRKTRSAVQEEWYGWIPRTGIAHRGHRVSAA